MAKVLELQLQHQCFQWIFRLDFLSDYVFSCSHVWMWELSTEEWSPGEGNENPLQYSCLENPMDRGVWQATVHGFASQTQLSDYTTTRTIPGKPGWMCTLITPSNSVYHVLLFFELSTPLRNLWINLYWIELQSTNSLPFPTMFCSGFVVVVVRSLNHVCLFCHLINCSETPLSMEYSRQEYRNGLPFPSSGYLPDQGVELVSPALAGRFFTRWATWEDLGLW